MFRCDAVVTGTCLTWHISHAFDRNLHFAENRVRRTQAQSGVLAGNPFPCPQNPPRFNAYQRNRGYSNLISQGGVACENLLLDRKQPTSLSEYAHTFASSSIDRVLSVIDRRLGLTAPP